MSFPDFWIQYPRKVARKDAERAWERLTIAQQAKALDQISLHAMVWTLEGRAMAVVPHAATWLRGERFEDELDIPQPKVAQWWATEQGTMTHGAKLGLTPRAGETLQEYRGRISAKERAA